MLSPNRRQVAHALLTRPPLIRTRRFFSVRLECVMHAASVHPEPGSNSLKNCISISVSTECYQLIRVILFAQLLVRASVDLFLSPLNSKEFSESLVLCFLSLYTWLLFNFQWALWFACCLSAAYLLYHIRLPLSRGFSNFFQVFLRFLFGSARSLVDSLYSISHQVNFVKSFLKLFWVFFDFKFAFPLSLRQLRYCTTSSQACQYLFDSFCLFVYYNQPP